MRKVSTTAGVAVLAAIAAVVLGTADFFVALATCAVLAAASLAAAALAILRRV